MQKQAFKFEVKDVSESGTFTGLASTYGNVDGGGDAVQPGAFARTLANNKGQPWPLLAGHDPQEQIGYAQLEDSAQGLKVQGQLVLHTERARQVYALMKAKALRGLSIGYDTIKSTMQNGVRHLQELKLYEISVTPFPMNELATVTAVKSDDGAAVERFRKTLEICTKEISRK